MSESDELTFRGRSVGYWLSVINTGSDDERWDAVDAIRHICEPKRSIPIFLEVLRNDRFWKARALAAHALFDMAWDADSRADLSAFESQIMSLPPDPSSDVRMQLAEAISVLNDPDPWQSRIRRST